MEASLTVGIHRQSVKALFGFVLYCLIIAVLIAAVFYLKLLPWPFRGAGSAAATYIRILIYLPFVLLALISLYFLRMADIPILENFAWRRFSGTFLTGFLISAVYACYLYLSNRFALKGSAYIPPVILLSLLNALSEEVIFRLVLLQLLLRTTRSPGWSNALQALVYGLPHFFIGGPVFFAYAVVYGLVLGWMTKANSSIIPAIICHFIIDLGAIGLPLLIVI